MKIYVYTRVSTEEQARSGAGLLAQKQSCEKWAKSQNIEISKVFCEEGISGSTSMEKRPELMNSINHMKKGDVLLVAKRDRLGRDLIAVAMIEATINRKGGRVISVAGEGTEKNDPSSILMRRMVDAFSEFERNIICERTRSAMQAKKSKFERVGHIPFGFCLSADRIHIEKFPLEQGILNQIEELKNQGLSTRKIAEEMNKRKAFNRGEKKWNHASIHRMMTKMAA